MDTRAISRQTFEIYRSTFENSLNMATLFQKQNQKLMDLYLEQMTDLPGDSRRVMQDWSDLMNTGVSDFRACMEKGFKRVEDYLSEPLQEKKKGQKHS